MQGIRFRWFVVNEICRKNLRDKFYCLINANLFTIDWNCITLDWKLFISGRPVWYRLYLESPDRPIRDFDPRPWSPRWLLLLLFCHFSVSTFSPESSHIHLIKNMKSHYLYQHDQKKLVQTCFNLKSYPTLTKNWNSSPKKDLSKEIFYPMSRHLTVGFLRPHANYWKIPEPYCQTANFFIRFSDSTCLKRPISHCRTVIGNFSLCFSNILNLSNGFF